jgi:hypothetical protein
MPLVERSRRQLAAVFCCKRASWAADAIVFSPPRLFELGEILLLLLNQVESTQLATVKSSLFYFVIKCTFILFLKYILSTANYMLQKKEQKHRQK